MKAVMAKVTAVDDIAEIEGDVIAVLPTTEQDGAVALIGALVLNVNVTEVTAVKPVMLPLLDVEPAVTLPDETVGIRPPDKTKAPPEFIAATSVVTSPPVGVVAKTRLVPLAVVVQSSVDFELI